jgi:hypothetical protein
MAENEGIDAALVEGVLRWQRGRGPRPAVPVGGDDLVALLDVLTDSAEVAHPDLDEDPVARRLGLVDADTVEVSLHELAHRLGGELDVEVVAADPGAPGGPRLRAVARTLAESVAVLSTPDEDLAALLEPAALLFARRPATTAVALVSTRTHLAAVVTEADCVTAIDPIAGRVAPALPREPEPFTIALGRHLERTRPRWDEIAHLDDMLVFAPDPDDVTAIVTRVRAEHLARPVRIPAKRAALAALESLPVEPVVAVVEAVRSGGLAGDGLLDRIRVLAGVGGSA